MERTKDITLDDICSIHFKFCCLAKDVVFDDKISRDKKETCWKIMEVFSYLVTSSDISYKLCSMEVMWDALFKFVSEYIREDGELPRRRTAVELYEIMKPVEDARKAKDKE